MTSEEHQIISRYQQAAPVDITALATELGLSVYETDTLLAGESGKICRDRSPESPSGYSIYVNGDDVYTRQRFTIAHELAHYLLHRDKIGDGIVDDAMYRSDKMSTPEEFAANNKAADLLMPRGLVMKARSEGDGSVEDLARRFEVSVSAMQVRLRYLLYL